MLARLKMVTDQRDSGASAVEYGLLVAGIAAVIIAIVFLLGGTLDGLFNDVNDCINNDGVGAACEPAGGTGGAGTGTGG